MKKFLPLIISFLAAASPIGFAAQATDTPYITVQEQGASVRVTSTGFEVLNPDSSPCSVEVFALTGRQVISTTAPAGVTSFDLAPGHYIVRVNSKATKIVVR